ncbi:uncharacterized protein CIMG_05770 [Coccidioides immitis RS]|uniref:Uncharacterized protein n=1 Tax=Coccidioides immitis (strain RS) TaxID=246410 RepID=J3K6R2_COCIM|nr:uncharacterized protein CIMG_05770 [Coccidioides immitis RS]EAS30291.3 hypothetical protein CIMG_05770 [Coccidioides immitis RS]
MTKQLPALAEGSMACVRVMPSCRRVRQVMQLNSYCTSRRLDTHIHPYFPACMWSGSKEISELVSRTPDLATDMKREGFKSRNFCLQNMCRRVGGSYQAGQTFQTHFCSCEWVHRARGSGWPFGTYSNAASEAPKIAQPHLSWVGAVQVMH